MFDSELRKNQNLEMKGRSYELKYHRRYSYMRDLANDIFPIKNE